VKQTSPEIAESRPTAAQKQGKILALDYGRARIGLAIADSQARIATPHGNLERVNRNEDMRRIREFVREHRVQQIVVGLPLRLDGSRGDMAEEATRFAKRLRREFGIPVAMRDERLTSWEAERILEEELGRRITHETTRNGKRKPLRNAQGKYTVDAIAAMVILREYLAGEDRAGERA
jgi:putative Holliday junction resolvase